MWGHDKFYQREQNDNCIPRFALGLLIMCIDSGDYTISRDTLQFIVVRIRESVNIRR